MRCHWKPAAGGDSRDRSEIRLHSAYVTRPLRMFCRILGSCDVRWRWPLCSRANRAVGPADERTARNGHVAGRGAEADRGLAVRAAHQRQPSDHDFQTGVHGTRRRGDGAAAPRLLHRGIRSSRHGRRQSLRVDNLINFAAGEPSRSPSRPRMPTSPRPRRPRRRGPRPLPAIHRSRPGSG